MSANFADKLPFTTVSLKSDPQKRPITKAEAFLLIVCFFPSMIYDGNSNGKIKMKVLFAKLISILSVKHAQCVASTKTYLPKDKM